MQLDRTHVVIRRRTLAEIGDLALVMLHRYPAAIFVGFLVGALPWVAVNGTLLYWIPIAEARFGLGDEEALVEVWRYITWMALLVTLQTPAAGVATTLYLGQAVFESQPTWKSVFSEVRRHFWRWFWSLAIVRFAVPTMVFLAFRFGQPANGFFDGMVPFLIVIAMMIARSNRPFMPEILLLEQCPLRSSSDSVITAGRRSKSLHQPMASDLAGRYLAVSFVLFFLFLSVLYTLVWARGIATSNWDWDLVFLLGIFPAALWIIAGVSVVVRLLNYLDTRIRLEGWEVELAVRAEAMRQFGEEAGVLVIPESKTSSRLPKQTTASVRILFLGFLLSFGCSASMAQTPQQDPSFARNALSNTPWYDSGAGELVPVNVRTTVDDSVNRDSRWLPKPKKVVQPKASTAPAAGGNSGGSWFGSGWFGTNLTLGNLFGWALLVLIVVMVVGALVYALSKTEIDLNAKSRSKSNGTTPSLDEQTIARMKHLPAELRRTGVDLRSEAMRLMQLGEFNQAVILLFGHQLLLLDRAGILRLNRGKTNGKYVRETQAVDPQMGIILRQTTDAFERSYFGRHSLTRDQFDSLWSQNQKLEEMVRIRHEVAA
ncbi:hypothetical protein CA13_60020 [Planctomycetes bacterium CA13]|uniref:Protein-glutamine gamma-glutamyltransferase-like C-terminal domain-containing protein n=1 Tax=Novipirellula herctigrandis TaxID=2527986 RepID=A0A5C5ZDB0_9BACT|nr:hypothetical protein CA13_60020 [Planctomycetes bacterium CA13]